MSDLTNRLLERLRIDPRQFRALTKAFVLMDLRSPHFAASTGTKPGWAISPLFWVFGQCLAISAIASLILFLRVSAYMYSFVGLATSMLVLATTVLVEFHEVVFQPRDLSVVGPQPVDARTYSAARFANLLFYVAMMFAALNLFPAVVGAGLDDVNFWYLPAYLVATMTGSLVTVCLVVLGLSVIGSSKAVEEWKAILAWTQIALFAVAAYGGQLMFRNPGQATEVWFAFPPDWVHWLPPAWLARFVDEACLAPRLELLGIAAGMLVGTAILVAITLRQISAMYETMQPVEVSRHERIMPPEAVGVLPGPNWFRRSFSTEFRIGCWLSWRALRQNAAHRMRCLYPVNLAVAVTLLGLLTDQFANPLTTPVAVGGKFDAAGQTVMPLLAVYLVALSVPVVLLNLTFSEWNGASWLLTSAPLRRPAAVTHGAIAIVQLLIVTPLCLLLWLCMFASWGDVVAATAHAGLAWLLSIPAALASVWVVIPDLPLTRPASRGGTLGTAVLPLSALSCVASAIGGLHFVFAGSVGFWIGALAAIVVLTLGTGAAAQRRFARLYGGSP